jgi:hypothetical protein
MTLTRLFQSLSVAAFALTVLVPAASAITITYNTNGSGTGFNGTSLLSLASTSGQAATLSFIPNSNTNSGTPSNINFGDFTLVCSTCGLKDIGNGATFAPFAFTIQITDQTDGATGNFLGNSSGGEVFSNASSLVLFWTPLQLGPGTSGATSGSFGNTTFQTPTFTPIVAPNSGTPLGFSTVSGIVNSSSSDVPEPATLGLVGGVLVGLGLWRRRALSVR